MREKNPMYVVERRMHSGRWQRAAIFAVRAGAERMIAEVMGRPGEEFRIRDNAIIDIRHTEPDPPEPSYINDPDEYRRIVELYS
jgi:hypothetical protein